MKKFALFLMAAVLLFGLEVQSFHLGKTELIKSGTGSRTKGILGTLYFATLYIPHELKGRPAHEIIEADKPMSVIMQIDSRLLTREKFIEGVNDGFTRAKESGYPTDKRGAFLKLFDGIDLMKGDIIILNYVPDEGLSPQHKSKASGSTKHLGTIAGIDLKKALLAIWIGPIPVQETLKKALLGN